MRIAVVGAGLCGLWSALLLARRGYDVTLVESLGELGGVARPVHWKGHRFSPGPQYIWGFAEGEPGDDLLRELGLDVPMLDTPKDFEKMAVGEDPFSAVHVPATGEARRFEQTLDALGRAEPVLAQSAGFRRSGLAMTAALATDQRLGHRDRLALWSASNQSVAELAANFEISKEELRTSLVSQSIFAESLSDLSALVFAAARRHLVRGVRVPRGGVASLMDALSTAVLDSTQIDCRLRCSVHGFERTLEGHLLHADEALGPFDRVVAACSPGVLSRILQRPVPFQPSNTMATAIFATEMSSEARQAFRMSNFTWYAHHDDVSFSLPPAELQTVNFVSPTLNGGSDANTQIVCAFFPSTPQDHATIAAEAVPRVEALLQRVHPSLRVVDRQILGPRAWTTEFGAFEGAIYGRRLTASSLQTTTLDALPTGWTAAHSGAGIPGVLGCAQMARAAVDELGL